MPKGTRVCHEICRGWSVSILKCVRWQIIHSMTCLYGHVSYWNWFCIARLSIFTSMIKIVQDGTWQYGHGWGENLYFALVVSMNMYQIEISSTSYAWIWIRVLWKFEHRLTSPGICHKRISIEPNLLKWTRDTRTLVQLLRLNLHTCRTKVCT